MINYFANCLGVRNSMRFSFGFISGVCIFMIVFFVLRDYNFNYSNIKNKNSPKFYTNAKSNEVYDHSLADILYNEVKIFCWVFTHPENHQTKVVHVRNTWGKRCNKLIFVSSESDASLDIIHLPGIGVGREFLWNKTRLTIRHVYKHYINDYDWFMRADDDKYINH